MAFTAFRTWVAKANLTAAEFNEQVRDNGDYLKDALDLHGLTSDSTLAQTKGALYGVRAVATASQSIPDASDTAVAYSATDAFDSDAFHDTSTNNSRITIPTGGDGFYLVGFGAEWAANSTGTRRGRLVEGGVTQIEGGTQRVANAAGANVMMSATTLYQFTAGEYFELFVLQNSTGSLDVVESVLWAARLFAS